MQYNLIEPSPTLSLPQFYLLQSESPSTTKLNDLGVYLLVSLFFVVFAMLEFAVVLLVQRDQDSKRNSFISQEKSNIETAFTKKGTTNTTINEMIGNDINEVKDIQKDNSTKNKNTRKIFRLHSLQLSTDNIDMMAFILYVAFYIIFNLFYWM